MQIENYIYPSLHSLVGSRIFKNTIVYDDFSGKLEEEI